MAFNKNSNGYTFLFAILMVVLVGAILAFTSLSLKPLQKANAAEKKMMNILGAIGVPSERGAVEAKFMDFVKERVSIDSDGRRWTAEQALSMRQTPTIRSILTSRKITAARPPRAS